MKNIYYGFMYFLYLLSHKLKIHCCIRNESKNGRRKTLAQLFDDYWGDAKWKSGG